MGLSIIGDFGKMKKNSKKNIGYSEKDGAKYINGKAIPKLPKCHQNILIKESESKARTKCSYET